MQCLGTRRVKSVASRKPGSFTVKLDSHCARLSVLFSFYCLELFISISIKGCINSIKLLSVNLMQRY